MQCSKVPEAPACAARRKRPEAPQLLLLSLITPLLVLAAAAVLKGSMLGILQRTTPVGPGEPYNQADSGASCSGCMPSHILPFLQSSPTGHHSVCLDAGMVRTPGPANGIFPRGCKWRDVQAKGPGPAKKRPFWAVEDYEYWDEAREQWHSKQPDACLMRGVQGGRGGFAACYCACPASPPHKGKCMMALPTCSG